jgi:putative phage-type endonuclease
MESGKEISTKTYLEECLQWMREQDLTSSQKSLAWLETRHSMITASDVHKCLSSEAQRNSLIRDKILPKPFQVSSSSLEHGHLFESVARRFYEILRGCQPIQEYGCLRHAVIPFIGASPDGAVVDPTSPFFGRLLEIKVPKSRELCIHERYIPIAYWEQMQVQMEVTGLPCCDYLECKVGVFGNQQEYEEDLSTSSLSKGLLVHFRSSVTGRDIYEVWIHQVDNEEEDYDAFLLRKETEMRDNACAILIKILFWKIENYFLATVERDKKWFSEVAFPRVKSTWMEIEEGRKDPSKVITKKQRLLKPVKEEMVCIQEEEENTILSRTSSDQKVEVEVSPMFIDTSMCIDTTSL